MMILIATVQPIWLTYLKVTITLLNSKNSCGIKATTNNGRYKFDYISQQ